MARVALDALEGMSLNVETSGEGPAVMALHGFTGSGAMWDSFAAAGGGFRIIRPDLPGHGRSDAPDSPRLYDMEHTVAALREILDRQEIDKAHWLGYSMGGRIALSAAVALPERTAGLVLESASPGLETPEEREARVISDEVLAGRIEKEGMTAFVDYWEALPLWASQTRLPEEVRRGLREQRLANNATGLANSLRGIGTGAQPPLHDRMGEIGFPCLFIAGADDIKYVEIAEQMYTAVKGSRISVIFESGHAVHLEQPGRFNEEVLDFIREVEKTREVTGAEGRRSR